MSDSKDFYDWMTQEKKNILKKYPGANDETIVYFLKESYKKEHPEYTDDSGLLLGMFYLYKANFKTGTNGEHYEN